MEINKDNAQRLWRERYGNKNDIVDFAGRNINFDDYGTQKVMYKGKDGKMRDYGWNIHHIFPGGSDNKENLEIVHWETNSDALDKPVYTILGVTYRIKKLSTGWYGIFRDSDSKRVDFTTTNN